eukprot:6211856-Pleurochrysis_carterae.AAC.2
MNECRNFIYTSNENTLENTVPAHARGILHRIPRTANCPHHALCNQLLNSGYGVRGDVENRRPRAGCACVDPASHAPAAESL